MPMQWFEYLIIVAAVALVIIPIVMYFVKKKKGTLRCECGHLQSECTGNCGSCSLTSNHVNNKNTITYVINVQGMKCGMCESHINELIRQEFPGVKVKSSYIKGTTRITSHTFLDINKIKKIINDSGYTATNAYIA